MLDIVCQYAGKMEDLISGGPVKLIAPLHLRFSEVSSEIVGSHAKRRQVEMLPLWNFEIEDNDKGELLVNSSAFFSVDMLSEEDKIIKYAKKVIAEVDNNRAEYIKQLKEDKSKTENEKVLDKYT